MPDSTVTIAGLLPDVGKGRWWDVQFQPGLSIHTKPMKVTLMEDFNPERRGMSTKLGYDRAAATEDDVARAARRVLAAVSGYKNLVGEFPTITTPKEGTN